jgi:hypothetical protein
LPTGEAGYPRSVAGARFVIDGDGRTGRCMLEGLVTGDCVHTIAAVIKRHLNGLDVLIIEADAVTAAEPTATMALAVLRATCRPAGVAFVLRKPSVALLAALEHEDLGEHLCAGRQKG